MIRKPDQLNETQLLGILSRSSSALAIYTSDQIIIEMANAAMLAAWGRGSEVIGQPLSQALPEISNQPFVMMLQQVWNTGINDVGKGIPADLFVDGKLQRFYFDYEYLAIKNELGEVYAILHTATDVTEKTLNREALALAIEKELMLKREKALNEELAATNEELFTAQNSLHNLNAELEERVKQRTQLLSASQSTLTELNISLQESETRLDQILSELPAPVVVLLGPNQVISTTNQSLLEFWDRTKEEVFGKPMLEVFPELVNQPFPALWKHVLDTGERIINREKLVVFKDKNTGADKPFYVDYYYQALTDSTGKRIGVLATVLDVSDKVNSRRKVEEAETQLRLAIDSSDLGTWNINAVTKDFEASPRLKEIFGFYPHEEMSYQAAVAQIVEGYREAVKNSVEDAISSGVQYDMEYPIIGFHDQELRWVRATGKLYTGQNISTANFTGTIQDITQRKTDEQRKDDFLSIASHELKTPVTTLKGSLQLLDRYKDNLLHPVVPRLIDQANTSVKKITNLMDDLLNTTRTNEGQLYLNKTRFVLAEMLNECCHHVRIGGKHELVLQGDQQLQIFADEARIDQVVVNLVNNAAKYAPESPKIYLIIENLGDKARISVKDTGPGIPKDKLPHLFDRYYRADYSGIQYSGLGLGLYISAEIVKRHGGEIGVTSELGSGSTFWFTLPIN